MDQIKSVFTYKHLKLKGSFQHLTLFELNPNTRIILNLSDHLSIPANDDSNSKPGHNHLEGRGKFKITLKIISKFKGKGQEGIAYVESASTHFGSKVCSANPEVSLVLVSDELHH